MIPNHPFSPMWLVIQIGFGGLCVAAIYLGGGWIGWVGLAGLVFATMYLSGIYNESSTNPEHDDIMMQLCALTTRMQNLTWKNLSSKGGHWDEVFAAEAAYKEFRDKIELDQNGLYRWKR